MMKKTYSCDICKEKIDDPNKSFGLHFLDLKNFTLGGYGCTEGTHICYCCATILQFSLNSDEIKRRLGI